MASNKSHGPIGVREKKLRGGVSVWDLCCRSFIGVCAGGVSVSDLRRRSHFGICRGGVSVSDLWRRSAILAFAEEVSV